MRESAENLREQTIKVLATISEMYPNSKIAKKLDGDDDISFESMIGVWQSSLKGVSAERIQQGLEDLVKRGSTFEPSIPEFISLCRAKPAAHQAFALPDYGNRPAPSDPASIDHYELSVQKGLKKLGEIPRKGENHHDYCMRCKDYCNSRGVLR